ncbi:bifunctional nuclease family protein [Pseudonocardia sp.]|uniref:bifunctional nuclease family protein n=1 Tax=Pseudonocardia sp. TaxID=60912 RepID=UPI00343C597D
MREAQVLAVGQEAGSAGPMMVLGVEGDERVLPIWIGVAEATCIAAEQQGIRGPRPGTLHLLATLIGAFERRLVSVRITELRDSVFRAELVFDADTTVSARPSDAVGLALHVGVPILVADEVLDEAAVPGAGVVAGAEQQAGLDEEFRRFRRFIDEVDPDEFGRS